MRIFSSNVKNWEYFFYRLINPIIDPFKLIKGFYGYGWFIRDLINYSKQDPQARILNRNLYPITEDKMKFTTFDSHYFYQEIWAFKHILKNKPKKHIDIASKYQFSGFVSLITPTEFVEIRPIKANLKNLSVVDASVLSLPYKNNSISSLSTLHVLEHIGLGRYGDPIDPNGTEKAFYEIIRVLKPNGKLYVSLPIGKYRLCFNAHRIHTPNMILEYCKGLKLLDFATVDDKGLYNEKGNLKEAAKFNYGCGMFLFTKPK